MSLCNENSALFSWFTNLRSKFSVWRCSTSKQPTLILARKNRDGNIQKQQQQFKIYNDLRKLHTNSSKNICLDRSLGPLDFGIQKQVEIALSCSHILGRKEKNDSSIWKHFWGVQKRICQSSCCCCKILQLISFWIQWTNRAAKMIQILLENLHHSSRMRRMAD